MERITELEEYIQEYRTNRIRKKKKFLREKYIEPDTDFYSKLDILIEKQIRNQSEVGQDKIKYIALSRLNSSSYTESYESYFWMSNSMLYFDENKSYVYWKPSFIYEDIERDMDTVELLLRHDFVRLEPYELFALKRKLISDDWSLFEATFLNLVKAGMVRIANSSVNVENEILILYGDYMEKLRVIGRINIAEGKWDE